MTTDTSPDRVSCLCEGGYLVPRGECSGCDLPRVPDVNTTAYPIEDGIQRPWMAQGYAPARYNGKGRPPKYPWHLMKVGQSFLVPDEHMRAVSAKASQAGARLMVQFKCHTVEGGVRVWRIT